MDILEGAKYFLPSPPLQMPPSDPLTTQIYPRLELSKEALYLTAERPASPKTPEDAKRLARRQLFLKPGTPERPFTNV